MSRWVGAAEWMSPSTQPRVTSSAPRTAAASYAVPGQVTLRLARAAMTHGQRITFMSCVVAAVLALMSTTHFLLGKLQTRRVPWSPTVAM